MDNLETWREDFATCPYCGYQHQDCFEWDCDEEMKYDCDNCGKKFSVVREVKTTYSTVPIEDKLLKQKSDQIERGFSDLSPLEKDIEQNSVLYTEKVAEKGVK